MSIISPSERVVLTRAVLDVHGRLLALRLSDTGVSVGLQVSTRQSPSLQTDSALT